MRTCATVFLVLGLLTVTNLRAEPPRLSSAGAKAYATVKDASEFCSTAVGIAGTTPPVVGAFRSLLEEEQADAAFKSLLTEAKLAGQLYALCGLWFTDPAAFKTGVEKYRKSRETVKTIMGCMMGMETVAGLVECPLPGAVRLRDNMQSIKEWAADHKGTAMHYDILGGGWPGMFKNEGGFRGVR